MGGGGSSFPFQTGNVCPGGRVEGVSVAQTARDFLYGRVTSYIVCKIS
jgi:hypothetical protein